MTEINFITGKSISKIHKFPDGEINLELDYIDGKYPVNIVMSIKSSDDVFLLLQLADILNRLEIRVNDIYFPYLMSMRNDRIFCLTRSFNLKIICQAIKELRPYSVSILGPHNLDVLEHQLNGIFIRNLSVLDLMDLSSIGDKVVVYPDEGSFNNYHHRLCNNLDDFEYVVFKKKRDDFNNITLEISKEQSELLKNRDVFVIDDLCDGGGTYKILSKKLDKHLVGFRDIAITHIIQHKGLDVLLSNFNKVHITDSFLSKESMLSHTGNNCYVDGLLNIYDSKCCENF